MTQKSIQEIWRQIHTWLEVNAPEILDLLQPGASDDEISELENFLSVKLPEDVKSSYRIHNGQSGYTHGLIANGWELLSLTRIMDEWTIWKELLDNDLLPNPEGQRSKPTRGICNVWWSPQWIPITSNGGGDNHCLDLNPAKSGKVGQIITMWHEIPNRKIVGTSFHSWIEEYADGLESGRFIFSKEHGISNEQEQEEK
jgi:cell wall assembly regulator SMI1